MDKLLDELTSEVGLDRGTAEKVVQFLKDNAHRLPELLGSDAAKGLMDKLPGGLGGCSEASNRLRANIFGVEGSGGTCPRNGVRPPDRARSGVHGRPV